MTTNNEQFTTGPAGAAIASSTSKSEVSPVIEIVTAKLRSHVTVAQMDEVDREIGTTLIAKRPGFISRESAPGSDHSWLAIVHWESAADADASMNSFAAAPISAKFMDLIEPETLSLKRYAR